MRVHLIKKATIEKYTADHAPGRQSFELWLTQIQYADWTAPGDITATFPTADLLGNGSNRVVFNIGGNKYRMICKYVFRGRQIRFYVCWIGTHAQYTNLCNRGDQYIIWNY